MPRTKGLLTVRPGSAGHGGFFVATESVSEAISHIRDLEERGHDDVHALDVDGQRYDRAELERIAADAGRSAESP